MKRLIVLLITALFFISSYSEGADWKLVTQKEDKKFYLLIDQDSIKSISDNTVQAWVMYEYREYLRGRREHDCRKCSPEKTLSHAIALKEFDCSKTKVRTVTLTEHYVGAEPYTEKIYTDWKHAAPDSNNGILLQNVCKEKKE
jgi:hypothetical protein